MRDGLVHVGGVRADEGFVEGRGGVGLRTRDGGFGGWGKVRGVCVRVVVRVAVGSCRGAEDFVLGREGFEFALEALVIG